VIAAYLDRLRRELRDPRLARRVLPEIEDHLREAVAADPAGPGAESERRAVAKFGDARAIARQLAAADLPRRCRRAGSAAVLVIAGTFAVMKARIAWYAAVGWAAAPHALAGLVLEVDRWAFWLAFICGIAAWLCSVRLRAFVRLGSVAGAALVACVAADGVLAWLRLPGTGWSSGVLVPLASIGLEIAGAGVLIWRLGAVARRMVPS
jgi:hypothetical protein